MPKLVEFSLAFRLIDTSDFPVECRKSNHVLFFEYGITGSMADITNRFEKSEPKQTSITESK